MVVVEEVGLEGDFLVEGLVGVIVVVEVEGLLGGFEEFGSFWCDFVVGEDVLEMRDVVVVVFGVIFVF